MALPSSPLCPVPTARYTFPPLLLALSSGSCGQMQARQKSGGNTPRLTHAQATEGKAGVRKGEGSQWVQVSPGGKV